MRDVCSGMELPSFVDLCASRDLRLLTKGKESRSGATDSAGTGRVEEALEILRNRHSEQHFLARTGNSLLDHLIYEFRNFRLTKGFLLDNFFTGLRHFHFYTIFHSETTKELAEKVAPFCPREADRICGYQSARACFEGPGKIAIECTTDEVIITPVGDPKASRSEDLLGIEKKLFGNALLYGLSGGIFLGLAGVVAGVILDRTTGIPIRTFASAGGVIGASMGAAPSLLLYPVQIAFEVASAVRKAFFKRFNRSFQESGENLANEILLPVYRSKGDVCKKTAALEAAIRDLGERKDVPANGLVGLPCAKPHPTKRGRLPQ